MDPIADLQAQVIALRTAIESLWLSTLYPDPNRIAHAGRMKTSSLDALRALRADDPAAAAMRDAVMLYTDQLWSSIEAQLGVLPGPGTYRSET